MLMIPPGYSKPKVKYKINNYLRLITLFWHLAWYCLLSPWYVDPTIMLTQRMEGEIQTIARSLHKRKPHLSMVSYAWAVSTRRMSVRTSECSKPLRKEKVCSTYFLLWSFWFISVFIGMKILEPCQFIQKITDSQVENHMVTLRQQMSKEVLFVFLEQIPSAIFCK